MPSISVQLRGISSTLHHSVTKCPFSVLSVTPLLQCSFAGGVIWCLCRSRVAFYAGCNKGAAVGVLGILTKEARYFGQPANSHVALTVLTTSEACWFEQRRRTPAAGHHGERVFPRDRTVMFLRRVRFHGCILARRPAIVTLSCGIEQHDAAAVHF